MVLHNGCCLTRRATGSNSRWFFSEDFFHEEASAVGRSLHHLVGGRRLHLRGCDFGPGHFEYLVYPPSGPGLPARLSTMPGGM